jgi:hypothetical protein
LFICESLGRGLPEFHSESFYALQAGRESRKSTRSEVSPECLMMLRSGRAKAGNAFINLLLFAQAETDGNWYERLHIVGDDHFSAEGNALVAPEVEKRLR